IWDWLDPETLIKAMAIVKKSRSDIKCFFMGVKPPVGKEPDKLKKLQMMCKELNLEDFVYFNDWVEYENRSEYLLEADIGISLHENHFETRFAYRTRLLDYIWCGLPIISSEGDVFSDIIEKNNLGSIVKAKNEVEVAEQIIEILEKDKSAFYKNHNYSKFLWSSAVKDLLAFCMDPKRISPRFSFFKEVKLYYWRLIYLIIRIYEKKIANKK
ncbi:glycosyltransferase, partial [Paenibacillus sp. P46E]|uniref:glycosyltransferase n=1 Tax=Paenibacillus sp. P46E TaxID=1349436 RepID=UPI000AF96843